jgi:hypothetical protein
MATLRHDIADIEARLEDTERTAHSYPTARSTSCW